MGIDFGRFKSKKDDNWVDWLADDPVPASIRGKMRAKAVEQASRPVVRRVGTQAKTQQNPDKPGVKTAAVSIHITIPKFKIKKPSFTIPPQLIKHKKWAAGGMAGVVLLVGITTTLLIITSGKKSREDTPAVLAENSQKPDFTYSLPKGSEEGLSATPRYNAERKVVSYKDSIGGIEITISQQPLPAGFENDTTNKVKKLAEDFSATKTIATANPTAYIGTSTKGPQTVIFSKKELLVFIQSTKEIDDHDWAEYITNLE